jgi:hypothetical protein
MSAAGMDTMAAIFDVINKQGNLCDGAKVVDLLKGLEMRDRAARLKSIGTRATSSRTSMLCR